MRKKPLSIVPSVYTNSENAIEHPALLVTVNAPGARRAARFTQIPNALADG